MQTGINVRLRPLAGFNKAKRPATGGGTLRAKCQHIGGCVLANLRSWIFRRCVRRLGSRYFRKLCLGRWWLAGLLFGGLLLLFFLRWFLNLLQLIVVRHHKHSSVSPETESEYDASTGSWSVRYATFRVMAI